MSKQERIVCAAIRLSYLFVGDWSTGTKNRHYHIVCGVTYDSIRNSSLFQERRFNYSDGFESTEGFVTSEDRFVDAKEAAHIALDHDQIDEVNRLWDLFSRQESESGKSKQQEIIYEKTSLILRDGLKPEDLY